MADDLYIKHWLVLAGLGYLGPEGTSPRWVQIPAGTVVQFEPTDPVVLTDLIACGAIIEASQDELMTATGNNGMVPSSVVVAHGGDPVPDGEGMGQVPVAPPPPAPAAPVAQTVNEPVLLTTEGEVPVSQLPPQDKAPDALLDEPTARDQATFGTHDDPVEVRS